MELTKEACEAAIADYTTVVELRPDDAAAYLARGLAWIKHGVPDRAIADYGEAVRRALHATPGVSHSRATIRRGEAKLAFHADEDLARTPRETGAGTRALLLGNPTGQASDGELAATTIPGNTSSRLSRELPSPVNEG